MTRASIIRRLAVAATSVAVGALVMSPGPAQAQDDDDVSAEQQLAERYAPIVVLKAQEEPCDPDGEPYAPTSVDIVLDNPEVLLRQVGQQNPVITTAPSAADLFGLNEGFFLDFPGSTFEPGCVYEQDFDKYTGTVTGERDVVVYAHVATQADEPDKLALQYWFYWYYNDWNNKHESDWEGIQLLFDVGTAEDALERSPVSTGYAQHEGGERADWDSAKLERVGDRPVVYPSAGSHASYYGSALYMGRSASEGFGCDTTDGPSHRADAAVVLLPSSVDSASSEFAWLDFDGRWGERQGGPFNGPTGPRDKERWTHPIDWHDELRDGSVVVPAGDTQADFVVNSFCGVVEWGSGQLVILQTSPARLLVTLGVAVVLAGWLARRTSWEKVSALPLVVRRRAGEIIRAAGDSYRHRGRVLITIGLVYVPTAIAVGILTSLLAWVPLVRRLVDVAGAASETGVVVALLAGGFANLLSYVAVNAMVAAYYDRLGDDPDTSGLDAVKEAWSHASQLLVGFVVSFLVVTLLLVSVVGAPVGIWLLVRFQFMPHAVVLEDRSGVDALRRSSRLVRGRWWHTAIVTGSFNLLVAGSGLVVGLLLLVVAAGLPLWLFSALITLVYALIVPLAAVGTTLLYGDAVAEERDAARPEPALTSA